MTWECDECCKAHGEYARHKGLRIQDGSMTLHFCNEECKQAFYDRIVDDAASDVYGYPNG